MGRRSDQNLFVRNVECMTNDMRPLSRLMSRLVLHDGNPPESFSLFATCTRTLQFATNKPTKRKGTSVLLCTLFYNVSCTDTDGPVFHENGGGCPEEHSQARRIDPRV